MLREFLNQIIDNRYNQDVKYYFFTSSTLEYGESYTNLTLKLAKSLRRNPKEIAEEIQRDLRTKYQIDSNIYLNNLYFSNFDFKSLTENYKDKLHIHLYLSNKDKAYQNHLLILKLLSYVLFLKNSLLEFHLFVNNLKIDSLRDIYEIYLEIKKQEESQIKEFVFPKQIENNIYFFIDGSIPTKVYKQIVKTSNFKLNEFSKKELDIPEIGNLEITKQNIYKAIFLLVRDLKKTECDLSLIEFSNTSNIYFYFKLTLNRLNSLMSKNPSKVFEVETVEFDSTVKLFHFSKKEFICFGDLNKYFIYLYKYLESLNILINSPNFRHKLEYAPLNDIYFNSLGYLYNQLKEIEFILD